MGRMSIETITNADIFLTVLNFTNFDKTANIKLLKSGSKADL